MKVLHSFEDLDLNDFVENSKSPPAEELWEFPITVGDRRESEDDIDYDYEDCDYVYDVRIEIEPFPRTQGSGHFPAGHNFNQEDLGKVKHRSTPFRYQSEGSLVWGFA